jgi:hypothetical protein
VILEAANELLPQFQSARPPLSTTPYLICTQTRRFQKRFGPRTYPHVEVSSKFEVLGPRNGRGPTSSKPLKVKGLSTVEHCAVPALLHTPLRLHTEDRKVAQGNKQPSRCGVGAWSGYNAREGGRRTPAPPGAWGVELARSRTSRERGERGAVGPRSAGAGESLHLSAGSS